MTIRLKRIYNERTKEDGVRILVDRMWPRGISKKHAGIDHWCRDLAPSSDLRKWFSHDPDKWSEFRDRYFKELDAAVQTVDELLEIIGDDDTTLLYAAKDQTHNNAVALKEYLHKRR